MSDVGAEAVDPGPPPRPRPSRQVPVGKEEAIRSAREFPKRGIIALLKTHQGPLSSVPGQVLLRGFRASEAFDDDLKPKRGVKSQ